MRIYPTTKPFGFCCFLFGEEASPNARQTYNETTARTLCCIDVRIHFFLIRKVQLRVQAFIVYYSGLTKNWRFSSHKNNIVNALTQYVHPIRDSAESHSECRKVRKDNWNIHKKNKEISKINLHRHLQHPPSLLSSSRAPDIAGDTLSHLQQIPSDICGRPPKTSARDGKPHLPQMSAPISGRWERPPS